jgi:hypothetical protein
MAMPQLTACPECRAPAEVVDRFVIPSTDGPVVHVKVRCVTGPWFVVPAEPARARPAGSGPAARRAPDCIRPTVDDARG